MSPGVRKFALLLHVVVSVGSIGAVAGFIALATAALVTGDMALAQAAYPAMEVTTWYAILPLVVASLITGIIQSLGTTWGLFRYYWVLIKLVLTLLTTLVLLIHMQPIGTMAELAREATPSLADHRDLQVQLLAAAVSGLAVLVVMTVLSMYKPRGLTRYGWRMQQPA
jgi:uncharacterized membrane protein